MVSKGEWSVTQSTNKDYPLYVASNLGTAPKGIALVKRHLNQEEAEANARLIAAAPELYKALRSIQKWLLDDKPLDEASPLHNRMFVKANNLTIKVLAKVRGE